MIRCKQIVKKYPPKHEALRGINFEVEPGEFVFVVGASGAGKSTLLRLLFGAESISDGQLVVAGRNLRFLSPGAISEHRKEIGFIFQDYKLLSRRTVIENIAFSLEVRGISKEARQKQALHLLDVIGLKDRAHSLPATLSGGEQQRVAVARALITKPKILLADEPTGNLDPEMSKVVVDLIQEANKLGTTVIFATHNLGLIDELNKRTMVLDNGKIIGDFAEHSSVH